MKTKITLFLLLSFSILTPVLTAQNSPIYSLVRPLGGGDLKLIEIDLTSGTESLIKTYTPAELNDYNPEITSFDFQYNRFLTVGYDLLGNESIISINTTTGNIDYSYNSPNVEPFSLVYGNGKIYSLARNLTNGDLQLIEFDLSLSAETVIKTYLDTELYDYNPESTSFDHQNNRIIAIGYDLNYDESVIAINTTSGNVDYSYVSPALEIFSPQNANGKVYSLARPLGGGDLQLVEINLILETETIIKTYLPSDLDDYNPQATSFDTLNKRFITIGYDLLGNENLISINISNGNIDYSYLSTINELFAIESAGSLITETSNKVTDKNAFFIYPNPAINEIKLVNSEEFTHVEIVNSLGKKVISETLTSLTIDISQLSSGLYFVRVYNHNNSHLQKMIKQ